MTDSLRINTGAKRILINEGPEFIEFNPSDVAFVENFYTVFRNFKTKTEEFKTKAAELDVVDELDEDGIPVNLAERVQFAKELCEYSYGQIDLMFGEGTSFKVFGGVMNLEMVEQFFSGLLPFLKTERDAKMEKYKANVSSSNKVMK